MHEQEVRFHVRQNFRDRPGWCITATIKDQFNQSLEYECTTQFSEAQGAMDALCGWMRRMSVEDRME